MTQFLKIGIGLILAVLGCGARLPAQTMDDLNLQFHGYATQGFVYSTNNNWNTTNSSDGSSAWTEAVINLTAQPGARVRIGIQPRYYLLGGYGNTISLDWAQADIKLSERFGFRVGKVKSPGGQLNDTQDIDPAYLWILLPQSIYAIASRNSILAHYGGVVYGTVPLGESFGKLEYRVYGGERVLAASDGYFQGLRDEGLTLPNGETSSVYGASLRWNTPLRGWMIGGTEGSENPEKATAGPVPGTSVDVEHFFEPHFFSHFERGRWMLAGEYERLALHPVIQFPGVSPIRASADTRSFYAMTSYRLGAKLTAGLYYSSILNRAARIGNARYQKDWTIAARYDFSPYLYAKAEQHIMDGTAIGYSTSNNTGGLRPNTRMTLLKLGVSF